MRIITDHVHPDEPCYGLQEVDRLEPMPDGSSQWRRVQAVYVVRGDTIAEYMTDLGPSMLFQRVTQIKLLAFGEESVGELMDEADRTRYDDYAEKLRQEVKESSTLIQDFVEEKERNWKIIRNQSVFGPGITRQRNGFDIRAAYERKGRTP